MNIEPRRPARILLVDELPIIRHALRQLLAGMADLVVCGEADSMADALRAVSTLKPDLVIVELSMGSEGTLGSVSGLELIRRLRTLESRLPVVVFSMLEEDPFARLALMAGARAYVTKRGSPVMLVGAIREVLDPTGESPAPETR